MWDLQVWLGFSAIQLKCKDDTEFMGYMKTVQAGLVYRALSANC